MRNRLPFHGKRGKWGRFVQNSRHLRDPFGGSVSFDKPSARETTGRLSRHRLHEQAGWIRSKTRKAPQFIYEAFLVIEWGVSP